MIPHHLKSSQSPLRLLSCCLLTLLAVLAMPGTSQAQIVGPDAFLQANSVQIGINQCGVYGSNNSAAAVVGPLGMYFPTEPAGLGFVADGAVDGWAAGFPPYCGDYFVPGSPEEGFSIATGVAPPGGSELINNQQSCGVFTPGDMPGSIVCYLDGGTVRSAIWEGTIPGTNLIIQQTTIVPVDALYFLTQVRICNTGATDFFDVWYQRNVDPDNDQPWSGDFTTRNTVLYNPPADPQALVISEGLTFGCFLGMGSIDERARASYGSFFTGSGYQSWNGFGPYSIAGINVADEGTQISFYMDTIPAMGSDEISFAYILDTADLDEALLATLAPVSVFADTVEVGIEDTVYICVGDSVDINIITGCDRDWIWFPPTGLSVDTGTAVTASPLVPTLYTAIGSGFCGDLVREIFVVPDTSALDPDAGLDETICSGDSVQLNGTGGIGQVWIPATGLSNDTIGDPWASPDTTTVYTMLALAAGGCPALDTMVVVVNEGPPTEAGPDLEICFGESVQLDGEGADLYLWSPGLLMDDNTLEDPTAFPDTTTTFYVIGTNAFGCESEDSLVVVVNPLPLVDAGADQTIDLVADEFALLLSNAPSAITWSWDPPDGLDDPAGASTLAQPQITTTYTLTVSDNKGCLNSDEVVVEVLNEFAVIIPDGFTPNGDGLNDVFRPVTIGLVEFLDVSVYNRWGELVWYSKDRNMGWDGTYKGTTQELATYIVVVRVLDPEGSRRQYTGTTTIIR